MIHDDQVNQERDGGDSRVIGQMEWTEEDLGPLRDAMERVKENFLMEMEDSRNSRNISVKPEKE